MYPRFLYIIFNSFQPYLPTNGPAHVLQDPNVYRRISKLGAQVSSEIEFDILSWLVNDTIEVMKVPTSPIVSNEDKSDQESSDYDDNHVDEQGEEMVVRENVAEV